MADTIVIAGPHSRKELVASAARTASDTSELFKHIQNFTSATVCLKVTAKSGTSPTLDVYIQKQLPSGSYTDVAHLTQATDTGEWYVDLVAAGNIASAAQDAAISAGSVKSCLLGSAWRVKWVLGGTNPSFTFEVHGDFFE